MNNFAVALLAKIYYILFLRRDNSNLAKKYDRDIVAWNQRYLIFIWVRTNGRQNWKYCLFAYFTIEDCVNFLSDH